MKMEKEIRQNFHCPNVYDENNVFLEDKMFLHEYPIKR